MTYGKHPAQLTMFERRHRHIEAKIENVGQALHRLLDQQIIIEEELEALLVKSKEIYGEIEKERNERKDRETD